MMTFNNDRSIDNTSIMEIDNSPHQQISAQSLADDLKQNRESLKRKLQTRRSLQQLVDVGIMPSSKTSLPFYEQRKRLQMRKTQDILKNKILSRPARQILIEHNILSDSIAAPAIQNTQRQLKRARLVDNLNDKLSIRPGILELVANNIFEIDSNLKQAIQDGHIHYPSLSRSLHRKTSSLSISTVKRSFGSLPKSKSCLTFHEYKGPLQKVQVTKVPLQLPLKSTEYNCYRIQLRQQQLFLELIYDQKERGIENRRRQQSLETMKLTDLKNVCRKLKISSTGTKMKLIENLKNVQLNMSDAINLSSQTMSIEPQIPVNSSASVNFSLLTSSWSDKELHQQQQQKLLELENQLAKFKQYDSPLSNQNQFSPIIDSMDNPTFIQHKCNPALSVQIQKRVLMQQHPFVPLTTDSIAQLLTQSTTNDVIANLFDEDLDSTTTSSFPSDDAYLNISNSSPLTHMDWMEEPSANIVDNNSDLTQFLNQFDHDHHQCFLDSIYRHQNTLSFDLFSP